MEVSYRRLKQYFSKGDCFCLKQKDRGIVCYMWKGSILCCYTITNSDLRLTFPALLGRIRKGLRDSIYD